MIIYHGSVNILEKPQYGKGKDYNDYGKGFYCTESLELAKEWACTEKSNGYANKYELNLENLKVLDLRNKKYNVLHWITLLIKNRRFAITNEISKEGKEYLINNFLVVAFTIGINILYVNMKLRKAHGGSKACLYRCTFLPLHILRCPQGYI